MPWTTSVEEHTSQTTVHRESRASGSGDLTVALQPDTRPYSCCMFWLWLFYNGFALASPYTFNMIPEISDTQIAMMTTLLAAVGFVWGLFNTVMITFGPTRICRPKCCGMHAPSSVHNDRLAKTLVVEDTGRYNQQSKNPAWYMAGTGFSMIGGTVFYLAMLIIGAKSWAEQSADFDCQAILKYGSYGLSALSLMTFPTLLFSAVSPVVSPNLNSRRDWLRMVIDPENPPITITEQLKVITTSYSD